MDKRGWLQPAATQERSHPQIAHRVGDSIDVLNGLVEGAFSADVLNNDIREGLALELLLDVLALRGGPAEKSTNGQFGSRQPRRKVLFSCGTHLRVGPNGTDDLHASLEKRVDDMDTEEAGGSGDEDLVSDGDVVSELMLQGSESSSCCAEQRPRRRTLDPEARAADDMIDMLGGKEGWGSGLDGERER